MGRRRRVLALLLAALPAAGCTLPTVPTRGAPETAAQELVWPAPPHRPRIRFVGTIARPRDLNIKASLWQQLTAIVTGAKQEWLVRPTGVAVSGQLICVADPGAQALWILHPRARRWSAIHAAGGEPLISPVAVAVGGGRVYLADSYLAKIFVYDSSGRLAATIASPSFLRPAGVAYDAKRDRLYVADSAAHRIWVLDSEGRQVGTIGRRGVGPGEFNFPTHVAVDRHGTLYVTDAMNFRLQMFGPDRRFTGQFGRHGDSSGNFASPKGVAIDSEAHVYVVEALFDTVQIFDREGRYLLSFGSRGIGPGQFWLPTGLFIDDSDRIYVADSYNQRIQIFQYLAGEDDG